MFSQHTAVGLFFFLENTVEIKKFLFFEFFFEFFTSEALYKPSLLSILYKSFLFKINLKSWFSTLLCFI